MPGLPKIYVDFTVRDPDGRFYAARIDQFVSKPELGIRFIGTDLDEFEVECEVLAVFYDTGQVLIRPCDAAAVPGTAPLPRTATVTQAVPFSVSAEQATDELVLQH